jgi:hypothetical protein
MKIFYPNSKPISIAVFTVYLFSACTNKQENRVPRAAVYKNGNISSGKTSNSGVTAPAGYSWSESQNNSGNSITTNILTGFSCFYGNAGKYKLTDDFVVPFGQTWDISSISVYAFRDGYIGNAAPIDTLKLLIWDGFPGLQTSSIVFGDSTTNVLTQSLDSLCFVIENSAVPSPGIPPNARTKIWKLSASVTKRLNAGTYWLVWQVHDILGGAIYSPPIKVRGSRTLPGWNGAVFNALNIWEPTGDPGNTAGSFVLQDLPFEIVYSY